MAPENTLPKDKATLNTVSEAFFPVYKENTLVYNCKEIFKKEKVENKWKYKELHQVLFVFKDEQPPDFLV